MVRIELVLRPLWVAAALTIVSGAGASGREPVARVSLSVPTAPRVPPPTAAAAGCIPAWVIDPHGIRRLPDRCPSAAPASHEARPLPALVRRRPEVDCREAYWIDARGRRRLRRRCP